MSSEIITVYQRGAVPGIAGILSPGTYELDYEARTATPVVTQIEQQQEQTEDTQSTTPLDDTQSES
jgi:hypothetical protein